MKYYELSGHVDFACDYSFYYKDKCNQCITYLSISHVDGNGSTHAKYDTTYPGMYHVIPCQVQHEWLSD